MNLVDMRRRAALTQSDVAGALAAQQSSVSNWENGLFEPNLTQVAKLAALYGVTTDDIIQAIRMAKDTA